jgi:hypothetical protein
VSCSSSSRQPDLFSDDVPELGRDRFYEYVTQFILLCNGIQTAAIAHSFGAFYRFAVDVRFDERLNAAVSNLKYVC